MTFGTGNYDLYWITVTFITNNFSSKSNVANKLYRYLAYTSTHPGGYDEQKKSHPAMANFVYYFYLI